VRVRVFVCCRALRVTTRRRRVSGSDDDDEVDDEVDGVTPAPTRALPKRAAYVVYFRRGRGTDWDARSVKKAPVQIVLSDEEEEEDEEATPPPRRDARARYVPTLYPVSVPWSDDWDAQAPA
jgi:hypothetical protein